MNIEIFYSLVKSFCLAGGLGYINYFILEKIGELHISQDDKDDKKFFMILFSLINLMINFLIDEIIDNIYISISITIILAIIFSFTVYKWISSLVYILINKYRKKNELGEYSSKTVRESVFDKNKVLFIYVYDLFSNEPIVCGCLGWNDFNSKDFKEFELCPFPGGMEQIPFSEAFEIASSEKNIDASVYINVDKKIKIVVIPEEDSN